MGVALMGARAQFLYRPGFWELWWLEREFLKHAALALPAALIIQKFGKLKAPAALLGLAPAFLWLGWPGWLAALGLALAVWGREAGSFASFLSAGVGLFFLAHAKEMAEVLLPLISPKAP